MIYVPKAYAVRPLRTQKQKDRAEQVATCGHCELSWDDGKITGMTPTPSGRCPFEGFHTDESRAELLAGKRK